MQERVRRRGAEFASWNKLAKLEEDNKELKENLSAMEQKWLDCEEMLAEMRDELQEEVRRRARMPYHRTVLRPRAGNIGIRIYASTYAALPLVPYVAAIQPSTSSRARQVS
jgi:hypothetical protein